jgi:uncharacterized protein YqeY
VSLRDQIQTDITAAMRGGDALRRDVLRMAANAAYNLEKRNQRPLTEDEYVGVLTREVKTRRESVEAYTQGGRADLAAKEQAEIEILSGYLPEAMSDAEIDALVDKAIAATGATSARDLGKATTEPVTDAHPARPGPGAVHPERRGSGRRRGDGADRRADGDLRGRRVAIGSRAVRSRRGRPRGPHRAARALVREPDTHR